MTTDPGCLPLDQAEIEKPDLLPSGSKELFNIFLEIQIVREEKLLLKESNRDFREEEDVRGPR